MSLHKIGELAAPGAFCERTPAAIRVSYERSFTLLAVSSSVCKAWVSHANQCAQSALPGAWAKRTNSVSGVEYSLAGVGGLKLCRRRNVLRSENIRRKPYRCLGLSVCLCRWQAAHPRQPLCRRRIYRRGIPPHPKSLSVRKKSPTSAWGRSTSSTRKTPERPDSAKSLPEAAAEAAAAEAAAAGAAAEAAAAEAGAEAAAAEAAAAACRGEFAVSARLGALRLR